MLELDLLGPPAIRVNGAPVALPTKKALALVAYLAIEGAVPRARLADALWPSTEPEKARGNLRRELNRLRHTPLGGEVVAEGATIALSESSVCDVREFSNRVQQRDFSGALALYKGPLLDGLEIYDADGFDDWLVRRRAALAERQRSMLALEAQACEARGELRAALQCYLDLIRLDRTQESFHKEAMRLHYLVGEREAALERFAELKRVLRRELALEPLPETIELYRSIRAAKRLEGSPVVESRAAAFALPLVGRAAEVELLRASEQPCVLLLADPGLGKSRLAEEVARGRPGHLILRASEASRTTALYPFACALRGLIGDADKQRRLDQLAPVWKREAARLVPELDPDAPVDSMREETRARFLEGLARTLAAAVGPGGMLVLDDVQWFDAASIELALHVIRRATALQLRLLATARPHELRASRAATLAEALEREKLGETVRLRPLGEDDVLALVRTLSNSARAPELAARLREATGGNPLYLFETLKELRAAGDLAEIDARAELPVPSTVRDAVAGQVERLGPKVRRLLEAASLAGTRFSLQDLEGATGLGAFDAVEAHERALEAGLVVREGDATRFSHDLVRRTLADGLGEERRRLIHDKLAVSLSAHSGAAAFVAEHYTAVGKSADAVHFRIRAAEDALKVFAHCEALAQYRELLALPLAVEQRFEVHLRCAAIHRVLDDRAAWTAEVEALDAVAEQSIGALVSARAALARAELEISSGRYQDALEHADRAAGLAGADESLAARALFQGARALLNLGRVQPAQERFAQADARTTEQDPDLQAEIHRALYACALEANDLSRAREHNELARRADEARGDHHGLVIALMNEGTLHRRAGDLAAAVERLTVAVEQAREAGLITLERTALLSLAATHNLLGEYQRAAELALRGIELAKEPEDPLLEVRFENALAAFEYSLGNLGSSLAHSERAIEIALGIDAASWSAFVRMGLGHTLLEIGEHARALEVIEAARRTVTELGLTGQHVVVETHIAHAELFFQGPRAAVARIEQALASGAPPSLDPDYTCSLLALAQHAAGDHARALETLQSHTFRPIHRARALRVEIDAQLALGQDPGSAVAAAEGLLGEPGLTPVESLELARSVAQALERAGEQARAAAVRASAERTVERLAASLDGRPEIAATLLRGSSRTAATSS